MENEKKLNQLQRKLDNLKLLIINFGVSLSIKCEKAINIVYCHHYFPRCDGTGDTYKAQRLCKATCLYYTNACSQELKMLKLFAGTVDIINCTNFPSRNAGETPECYYFYERNDEKGNHCKDCVYSFVSFRQADRQVNRQLDMKDMWTGRGADG